MPSDHHPEKPPKPRKPSLHDLTRQLPTTDQFESIITDAAAMDPRAAALVLASITDNLLEFAIRLNFVSLSEKRFNVLFRNPTAPLSSFSAKIAVGHALGLYGEEFRSQLDRLRGIRNAFAHAMLPVTFDEPLIAEECRKLDPARLTSGQYKPEENSPRERFTVVSTMIATHLIKSIGALSHKISVLGPRPPWPDKFEPPLPPDIQNPN